MIRLPTVVVWLLLALACWAVVLGIGWLLYRLGRAAMTLLMTAW